MFERACLPLEPVFWSKGEAIVTAICGIVGVFRSGFPATIGGGSAIVSLFWEYSWGECCV